MRGVILVFPKTSLDIKGVTIGVPWGVLYSASALLEKGYNVKIIDQRVDHNWKKLLLNALKENPLFVGISSMTGKQILHALGVSKFVKENSNAPVVWGGIHASLLPKQTIENKLIDIIIRGEGDITIVELAKALEENKSLEKIKGLCYKKDNEIKITEEREFIDVNNLPEIPFHLINVNNYFLHYIDEYERTLTVFTSRGCPFPCTYCYNASFNKCKWRPLNAKKSIDLLTNVVRKFKLTGLVIYDDDFFVDLKRVKEICSGIIKNKLNISWFAHSRVNYKVDQEALGLLKKSGCKILFLGIESGSDRILKMIKKGFSVDQVIKANLKLKEAGIIPRFGFMSGYPTETKEEREMTYDLIDRLRKDNPKAEIHNISMCTPYPGTELIELSKSYGFVPPKTLKGWAKINYSNSTALWLKKEDRRVIERVYFISRFIDDTVTDKYTSSNLPIKIAATMLSKFAKFRWKHRLFEFSPEIDLAKYIYEKGIF